MTFYMGYARDYPYETIPYIEENDVPLLTNAIHRWSEAKGRFLHMWEYDTEHVLDSGGYNVQAKYVDRYGNLTEDEATIEEELSSEYPFYPWTLDEYHEWLEENAEEVKWAAPMDYACEDRFDVMWGVEERIEHTIENTIEQWHKDRSYKLLPVLQGTSVDDYVDCANRLQEAGVDISHVGLGTVCRMSSTEEIVRVEREVRERIDAVDEIHGFGVKVGAYKLGASFESGDSASWVDKKMNGKTFTLHRDGDGFRLDEAPMRSDPREASEHSFKVYYAYCTWLKEGEPAVDVEEILDEQEDLNICDERPEDSHLHS